jgi:hypothetical protein
MQQLQSIFIGWIILLSRVTRHYYGAQEESRSWLRQICKTSLAGPKSSQSLRCIQVEAARFRPTNKKGTLMKPATIIGILLILFGIVGFAVGGISFTHEKKDVDLGPVQIGHKETSTLPISPILSTISLLAGVGLVFVGSKS